MKAFRNLAVLLCILFTLSHPVRAQGDMIEEVDFWSQLSTTNLWLQEAIAGPASGWTDTITRINDLWVDINGVRLTDGTTIKLDLGWLQLPPFSGILELSSLQWRVQAILNYHVQRTEQDPMLFLNRLQQILQDRRFRGEPETTSESSTGSGDSLSSPGLSQLIMFVLAALAVAALMMYVWRNFQVQPANIDFSDAEVEPTTSQAAAEKAEQLNAIQDFRAAIRYLYLASLLSLDERGVIRYDPALTNREHLQQLANRPQLYQRMLYVVDTFDRIWYGLLPADQHLYQSFRQHIDQLRQG